MLETIKTWISEHKTKLIIAAAVILLCVAEWAQWKYNEKKLAALTSAHIDSIVETKVQTQEVYTSAEAVHKRQEQNDKSIREKVEEAVAGVPDELVALVARANDVIRGSRYRQYGYSADDGSGLTDAGD